MIELLPVIAIIGILAGIILSTIGTAAPRPLPAELAQSNLSLESLFLV